MDNKKFGAFIASLRKEKGWTQNELAERLHVTDKAVSKWERGVGFPDIKLIESLAEVLEVSILEIMNSEKYEENHVATENATEAITNVIDVVSYQKRIEGRNLIIGTISIALLVMMVFLIDLLRIEGFIILIMPFITLGTGIFLTVISIKRKRRKQSYAISLILAILAFLYPVAVLLLLAFSFALGGPAPT